MTWDAQHRMASCTADRVTATFTSGADGLRRSMTTGGVTTYYVYDGQSLVREMQGAPGSLHATATYLTGPRGPEYRRDDTRQETDGQGHTYGVTRWYVYDGLGSVVGEVDPAGNVTCADKYDVYGAVRGRAGTASTAHGFVGSLGHLSDAATGLVYMRARYYDPATGRFASEDPGKNGNNWFVYCDDDPISRYDPSGKDGEMVGTLGAMNISGGLDANAAMSAVAESQFNGVMLANDAEWMSTAGEGKPIDFILRNYGQGVAQTLKDSWDYYKCTVTQGPGTVMKAWLHYNGELFDAYLKCDQVIDGADYSGFASHGMPYIE